ncbi:transient receptor potential cation channel protein painless [Leptinotarsa decemlineata]|uniref:transient receptor potential cation channel protein painless n=1 Tax=Leptinotarsa decemlineata TaxID=7539 RepID=UPI003D30B63B
MGIKRGDIEMGRLQPLLGPQNPPSESLIHTEAEQLLNAVINNEIEKIATILKNASSETLRSLLNEKFCSHNEKSIVLIACDKDEVTKETVSALYSYFACTLSSDDCIDDKRFGWEPIHYVAKNADPEKLEVLLKYVSINSHTYFSENALHVLLQYGKSSAMLKVNLFNGTYSRSCTIISEEKENIVKCSKLLIEKGIDINHANFWGETPICLALKYRYLKVTQDLLKNTNIDLDNYYISGRTIREYLRQNNFSINSLPSSSFNAIEDTTTVLFNFLKSGDEEGFIRYANEVKTYCGDLSSCNLSQSGTMLELCLRKGFLECIQNGCYDVEYKELDIRKSPMLKTFCKKGMSRCIGYLLENGADPMVASKKFPEPPLVYAARRGYYPYVAAVICHKNSRIETDQVFSVLKLLEKKRACDVMVNTVNGSFYRKCSLYLLLNKLISTFDRIKENLTEGKMEILRKTVHQLDLESDNKSIDTELVCQLLHLGVGLTETICKSNSAGAEIIGTGINQAVVSSQYEKNENMLVDLLDINNLREHLDDCIENNWLHYNSIIQDSHNEYNETKTISFLANDKIKKQLLVHPLFIYFISKKWQRVAWVFYLDLFFYSIFLLSICAYMICLHTQLTNVFLNVFFPLSLMIHIIKETCQLIFLYHWKYFKDSSNLLEVTVILSCTVSYIYPNIYSMTVAILFATSIFFIMLGQLPIFAKYTIIFGSAKYFIEYTGFYFIQFLSFSICFYIIFPFNVNPSESSTQKNITDVEEVVGDLFKSLFYTLIHFTGDFGDRVLEPTEYPVFGRVFMTIFIFCMTIILNNLLVGLIVTDMDDIQNSGRLYKQVKIANFIKTTDIFVKRIHEWKWMDCIKRIIRRVSLFKKNQTKNLPLKDSEIYEIFDEETKEYLKNLKSKKQRIFDRNVLKDCHDLIMKNDYNSSKQKK